MSETNETQTVENITTDNMIDVANKVIADNQTTDEVGTQTVKEQPVENNTTEKLFTQDEVNQLIKSRIERELAKREKSVKSEVDKLNEVTSIEKLRSELESTKKQLTEIQDRYTRTELKAKASEILSDNGIKPTEKVLNILVTNNADETLANINAFTETLKTQATDIVRNQMKGQTPVISNNNQVKSISKADILAVKDTRERQRLIQENMHLFK